MEAKFETRRADGSLQLSSDMMQFYRSQGGTVPLNDQAFYGNTYGAPGESPSGLGLYTYTIGGGGAPAWAAGDILVYQCTEYLAFTANPIDNYGLVYPATRATNSPILTWHRFRPFKLVNPSSFGLWLKNAAGELTFDALRFPLMPVLRQPITSLSGSVTLPSGRVYAGFMAAASERYDETLVPGINGYMTKFNGATVGFRIRNNVVSWAPISRTVYSPANSTRGQLVIVDVTYA